MFNKKSGQKHGLIRATVLGQKKPKLPTWWKKGWFDFANALAVQHFYTFLKGKIHGKNKFQYRIVLIYAILIYVVK